MIVFIIVEYHNTVIISIFRDHKPNHFFRPVLICHVIYQHGSLINLFFQSQTVPRCTFQPSLGQSKCSFLLRQCSRIFWRLIISRLISFIIHQHLITYFLLFWYFWIIIQRRILLIFRKLPTQVIKTKFYIRLICCPFIPYRNTPYFIAISHNQQPNLSSIKLPFQPTISAIILKPFGFQLLYHFRFRPVHRNTEKLRHVLLCESIHTQHQKHQERKTPHFHDFHILTFRPTPLPESIKSLIVYIYEKSAGVCTCCSFRYSRLSHCPSLSERATQKPTPICLYIRPLYPCNTHGYNRGLYKTHPQGIYRCFVFDSD